VEKRGKESEGYPGDGAAGGKHDRGTEPSEDFAERPDVETADQPVEQHDRRHDDRGRDVESR
jgi:hypothetical protein